MASDAIRWRIAGGQEAEACQLFDSGDRMNLMHLYRSTKQALTDLARLDERCKLLDETTAALESRLKVVEAASLKGGSDGEVPVKRGRGRPRKASSGD